MKVTANIEMITPAMADSILKSSYGQKQRPIKKGLISRYSTELTTSSWELTGESIIIDVNGFCIDGQHRLHAISNTGVSLESVIVRGISSDAFHCIGTGKSRSSSDVLSIDGYSNTAMLSAVITTAMIMAKYGVTSTTVNKGGSRRIMPHTVLEFAHLNPSISLFVDEKIIGDFKELKRNKNIYYSTVLALMYILWTKHPDEVDDFLKGVSSCENMTKEDPRMRLSNILVAEKMKKPGLMKTPKEGIISLWVQAWNSFITEVPRKHMKALIKIPKVAYQDNSELIFPNDFQFTTSKNQKA